MTGIYETSTRASSSCLLQARKNMQTKTVSILEKVSALKLKSILKAGDGKGSKATSPELGETPNSVTFFGQVRVRTTISRKDYSQEEIAVCWYSHDELEELLQFCGKEILMLEKGEQMLDKVYCGRGLEGYTPSGNSVKRKKREESGIRLLAEQRRQYDEAGFIYDPRSIARACRGVSSTIQISARAAALRDQKEAESIYAKDNELEDLISRSQTTVPVSRELSFERRKRIVSARTA